MSNYAFSKGRVAESVLLPENPLLTQSEWVDLSNVVTSPYTSGTKNTFYYAESQLPTATLWVHDLRLNIPAKTNIVGIKADVVRKSASQSSTKDYAVYLSYPSNDLRGWAFTPSITNFASSNFWPSYNAVNQQYGGETYLWNKTWTVNEVNDYNFGFGISVAEVSHASWHIAYVYQVLITVYYEPIPPVITYIYPTGGAKLSRPSSSTIFTFNSKYVATAQVKVNGTARVINRYPTSISGGAKFAGQASVAVNKLYAHIASGGAKFAGQSLETINKNYIDIASGGAEISGHASEFINILSFVEIKTGGSIVDNIVINNSIASDDIYLSNQLKGVSLSGKAINEIIIEEIPYGGLSLNGDSSIGISQEIFGSSTISGDAEISLGFMADGGCSINGDIEVFANYNIDENLINNGLIALSTESDINYIAECETFGGSSLSGESELFEILTDNPTSGSFCSGEAEVIYSGLLFGGMSISGEAEVVLEMMTPIDSNGISISGEIDIQYNALIDIESYGVFNAPLSVRSIESIVLGGCNVGGSYYGNTLYNLGVVLGSCFLNGSNQNNQTFNHPPDFGGIIVFARFRPSYLRYYEKRNLKICLSLNSETICNKVIPDPKKTIMNKTGYDQDIATNMFQVEISSGWCDFNDSCQNAYLPAIVKNRQGKYLPEKSRRYSIEGQIATMN